MPPRVLWPEDKSFAFSIFDDPDSQTLEGGKAVYGFLREHGFRTTKGVWPSAATRQASDNGVTCADPEYTKWLTELQDAGFEIALHNVTSHTSLRDETIGGLDRFAGIFGHDPQCLAHHYYCDESLYWGDRRLSGTRRLAYNLATRFRNYGRSHGHVPGHPEFWGDVCRARIKYVRNFVFGGADTLAACPFMPYHDSERPFVNYWYASSEGSNAGRFTDTLSEAAQDSLEASGGACIMYTHFGHGYTDSGLNPRFRELMQRLSKRNGWFVPVSTLLDHLLAARGEDAAITPQQRKDLERRWLLHKFRYGTA